MTQSASHTIHDALQAIDRLIDLTEHICTLDESKDISKLSQLLMQRGKLVSELQLMQLGKLPVQAQQQVAEKLARLAPLEQAIDENLHDLHTLLDKQLHQISTGKARVNQYKIAEDPVISTKTTDA